MTDDEANNLRRQLDRYRLIRRSFRDPNVRQTMDVLIAETEEKLRTEAQEEVLAHE